MGRRIRINWEDLVRLEPPEYPFPASASSTCAAAPTDQAAYADYLDAIGLIGMGGSGFSTGDKIRACSNIHTLVINAVECEPGIGIDQSVLLHESDRVRAGARASAAAVGAKQTLIAVAGKPPLIEQLKPLYPDVSFAILPDRYPAGAEKLILRKLTGRPPPPGVRPHQLGYLMQNVVSLRAIGRAVLDGIPVRERPLTLAKPSTRFYHQVVVPIETPVRDLLQHYALEYDPSRHILIDSGVMMGRSIGSDALISKTTLSILLLDRDTAWFNERPCIRCGACNTACPLNLHPYALVEKIRKHKTDGDAFTGQMTECFLCGVCSAVCPSDIPLVHQLKEGKRCL